MKHAILLSTLLACGGAWAQSSHENVPEQPGSTDSSGTMGAGTVNPAPSGDPTPLAVPGAVGRGERGEPNDTVSSGVDRTSTTATTGMPIPFASVDKDENGTVDWEEGQVLRDTGHDFKAADSDGDGLLSAAEYQRMTGSRTP